MIEIFNYRQNSRSPKLNLKETLTQEFPYEFCGIFKNTYFRAQLQASIYVQILPSGAYVTPYMRDYSHYEMRENKPHLSCGFP